MTTQTQHGSPGDWTAFLDRLVHDMREPLRSVHAFSELLGEMAAGRLGAEGDGMLKEIVSGAARMRTILEGVSAYSVALRDCPASPGVSPQTAFRIAAAKLEDQIRAAGAAVTGVDTGGAPMPKLDIAIERLAQVFENLIANALRFRSDRAPLIRVSALPAGDGAWAVSVEDNGIGVAPENREAIFQPFVRVEGRKYPGAGLGLAVSRAIVEARGGTICVEPAPGGGAIFRFTLPES